MTEQQEQEQPKVLFRGDDVELSERLLEEVGGRERWTFTSGQFFRYDDTTGVWRQRDRDELLRATQRYAGSRVSAGEGRTRALHMSASSMRGVVECARASIAEELFFSRAKGQGAAFKNGFVSVGDGGNISVVSPSPEHRIRFAYDFAFRDVEAPRWQQFLDDVFMGDESKVRLLQEFVGLAMVGAATSMQRALVLMGDGANGKSILLRVLDNLFPAAAKSSIAPQDWGDEYYRAQLDGIAWNVVSEMPERDMLSTPAMKAVIAGDAITGRHPRERPFRFIPRAAHVFAVNPPLPAVADMSPGFWRRWSIITFDRSFERDPIRRPSDDLVDDLSKDLAGIAYWGIAGAARALSNRGYSACPSSDAAVAAWRSENDVVARFVDEDMQPVSVDYGMLASDAYARYRTWSARTGHRVLSLHKFSARLEGHVKKDGNVFGIRPRGLR